MSRTGLFRLLKFSVVGGIGVGVQLGMLALFRVMAFNFLPATALAVNAPCCKTFYGIGTLHGLIAGRNALAIFVVL